MTATATRADLATLRPWRTAYLAALAAQAVRDALHARPGWSEEYRLAWGGAPVGYGSVAVAGPWAGDPAVYELWVDPAARPHLRALVRALAAASGARAVTLQSNAPLATAVLDATADDVRCEKVLWADARTTALAVPGARVRGATAADALPDVRPHELPRHAVVELGGAAAGYGGVMTHYNAPYGDVCLEVAPPFRRRGLGGLLVQELKRLARAGGLEPAARCDPDNVASRRTLARAGFAPIAEIRTGRLTGG
jgi:GNAT superfamily N-acetyltransferase